jgi:hypothetical protein
LWVLSPHRAVCIFAMPTCVVACVIGDHCKRRGSRVTPSTVWEVVPDLGPLNIGLWAVFPVDWADVLLRPCGRLPPREHALLNIHALKPIHDRQHRLFEIDRIEVEPRDVGCQQFLSHIDTMLDAELFDPCIVRVDWLELVV